MSAEPSPWPARRLRAEELLVLHPFAADLLTLYLALLPVEETAWHAARESAPHPEEIARWTEAHVLPGVVEATVAAGPPALAGRVAAGAADDALAAWLEGAELDPVDQYLARASLSPVLEALGEREGVRGTNELRCPCCGGLPQLGYLASSGDALVSGGRSLLCARCGSSWNVSRTVCASCGETDDAKLVVYAEHWAGPASGNGNGNGGAVFPHLRVAACTTCRRYLIEVDLERDGRAVPEVDELAALPLDLYAADQGLTKMTPNLLGF